MIRKIIFVFVAILFAAIFFIFFLEIQFYKVRFTKVFYENNHQKFWAHKGYTTIDMSYRTNNLQLALTNGLIGVELDVFYSTKLQRLLVVHDFPIKDTIFLDEYLTPVGNKLKYWFDLKNLKNSDVTHVAHAFIKLNQQFNLNRQFIIESKEATKLGELGKHGLYTCLWINTPDKKNLFNYYYQNFKNKYAVVFNSFSAISMPYYVYQKCEYKIYEHLPIHTWIDDKMLQSEQDSIFNDDNLKIVLVDRVE